MIDFEKLWRANDNGTDWETPNTWQQQCEAYRQEWQETGDPGVLQAVLAGVCRSGRHMPDWAYDALQQTLEDKRSDSRGLGKGKATPAKREEQHKDRELHHGLVSRFRKAGHSRTSAISAAVQELERMGRAASWKTVERNFDAFEADLPPVARYR